MLKLDDNMQLWLSQTWLANNGVLDDTLRQWSKRNAVTRKYINNRAYVNYDTIPAPSREKLPPKAVLLNEVQNNNIRQTYFYQELSKAYNGITVGKWRNIMQQKYSMLTNDELNRFSRKAAVFECIERIYSGGHGELEALFAAYSQLFPDNYSLKNRFSMAMKQARTEGVLSVAVDKRVFREFKPVHDEQVQYWAMYVLSHNKGFNATMAYDIFVEVCKQNQQKTPKIDWFRKFYKANKNIIDASRLGNSAFEQNNRNYAKIIPALFAGDQWQIDGWRVPVYCKKQRLNGGYEYFVTYTFFAVLDSHSRKIIGYEIAESENTETILKGIERAVKLTKTLPFEVVADKHSFNKTKEAENIKLAFDSLGVTWTVDSNPRRKALLERAFKTLGEKHFKRYYGYIGQGIKTKEQLGRTQQELIDIYTKPDNFLTFDQLKALVIMVVNDYNNSVIEKLGDTPNNLYEKSEQPHSVKLNEYQYLQLFERAGEYKISHGQITIKRGGHTYEYQLPAELSLKYNNQIVSVRYIDFETIYLFDKQTDEPLGMVKQKFAIHGALANQTTQDIEYLNKNKGRIKGIERKRKQRKQSLFDAASTINPNAYDAVNKLTTSKDVLEKLKHSSDLRSIALEFDIIPENITPLPQITDMLDNDLKPSKKAVKSPFTTSKGSMETIIINE